MVNVWYFLFLFSFVVFLIFIAVVTSIPGLFGDPLLWRVPKDWYFLIPLPMKVRIFVPHLVQLNLCLIGIHRPIFTIRNSSCTKVMFYTCLWFCSQGGVYLWVQGEGGCTPPGQTPPRQTPLWANTLLGRHSLEQTPLLGRHTPTPGQTPHVDTDLLRQLLQQIVCILLECILVLMIRNFYFSLTCFLWCFIFPQTYFYYFLTCFIFPHTYFYCFLTCFAASLNVSR